VSDLPTGWAYPTVAELSTSLVDGPFGSNLKSEHYSGVGVRVIRLQNIADGAFVDDDKAFIPLERLPSLARHQALPGDILIAAMGDILPRVCLVPSNLGSAIVKADCFRLRPSAAVTAKYLAYALSSPQIRSEAKPMVAGIGRPRLNLGKVGSLHIPLAPVAEQSRIVASIEELFSRLSGGAAALERARQRLRALRDQGILALIAATGEEHLLGEVASIQLGRQRSPKNHAGPRMRPYLRAANVTWSGLELSDVKEMNFTTAESLTYELAPGDIVVAEASGSASEVGKPAIWDGSIANCCFQNTLLRVRSAAFLPEYLYLSLLAHARSGTFARASRGVGIHHLSKSGLSALRVKVPPLDQQRSLAARLQVQQAAIAEVEDQIQTQSIRMRSLRAAILASAFSGQLIRPDPTDEPADVLLRRISAERSRSAALLPPSRKPRATTSGVPA
jgi:type I restriction enzyme, S subunit